MIAPRPPAAALSPVYLVTPVLVPGGARPDSLPAYARTGLIDIDPYQAVLLLAAIDEISKLHMTSSLPIKDLRLNAWNFTPFGIPDNLAEHDPEWAKTALSTGTILRIPARPPAEWPHARIDRCYAHASPDGVFWQADLQQSTYVERNRILPTYDQHPPATALLTPTFSRTMLASIAAPFHAQLWMNEDQLDAEYRTPPPPATPPR